MPAPSRPRPRRASRKKAPTNARFAREVEATSVNFLFGAGPSYARMLWIAPHAEAYSLSVMTLPDIDLAEFVATVGPVLERQNAQELKDLLRSHYSHEQIKAVLASDDLDARKVAA